MRIQPITTLSATCRHALKAKVPANDLGHQLCGLSACTCPCHTTQKEAK